MTAAHARISYLNQADATQFDIDIMQTPGFSVDQLMELAGLSVACAIYEQYPPHPDKSKNHVLVVAGPGNNGGDALVAARHLAHFGYMPYVVYPKPTPKPLYLNLVEQLKQLDVAVVSTLPALKIEPTPSTLPDCEAPLTTTPDSATTTAPWNLIVDGIFGFSFKCSQPDDIRAPFKAILQALRSEDAIGIPLVSIDIPSGWDVEKGNIHGIGLAPDMLVSLTAPKLCAREYKGVHYLGGRFVPPALMSKYNLTLPPYQGSSQCLKLSS